MGFDLGAGVEFPSGPIIPYAEFIYYIGMTNMQGNSTFIDPSASVTNNGFEIKGGLKFKF